MLWMSMFTGAGVRRAYFPEQEWALPPFSELSPIISSSSSQDLLWLGQNSRQPVVTGRLTVGISGRVQWQSLPLVLFFLRNFSRLDLDGVYQAARAPLLKIMAVYGRREYSTAAHSAGLCKKHLWYLDSFPSLRPPRELLFIRAISSDTFYIRNKNWGKKLTIFTQHFI